MRASGVRPSRSAAFSEPSHAAEAPSFMGEALPAVTVPLSLRNTVRRPPSVSGVESARTVSSRVTSLPRLELAFTVTVRSS